jgi:hypothetical protein
MFQYELAQTLCHELAHAFWEWTRRLWNLCSRAISLLRLNAHPASQRVWGGAWIFLGALGERGAADFTPFGSFIPYADADGPVRRPGTLFMVEAEEPGTEWHPDIEHVILLPIQYVRKWF